MEILYSYILNIFSFFSFRQLLAGVDNLRQMAANIEKSETHVDYEASPDLFSDFIDDCDDYEEYPGGPAL